MEGWEGEKELGKSALNYLQSFAQLSSRPRFPSILGKPTGMWDSAVPASRVSLDPGSDATTPSVIKERVDEFLGAVNKWFAKLFKETVGTET